jgi:hypothetical protein
MTSVLTNYSQRDNRLENVTLTGFITNNGGKAGEIAVQRPAYAAIDLTKSKNFNIDARVLTLRTDSPIYYLLRIYISSSKPPAYYQNFEFDIFITPPDDEADFLFVEIFADKRNAENALIVGSDYKRLYAFTNKPVSPEGDYSANTGVITFKVLNNSIILKSIPPDFSM